MSEPKQEMRSVRVAVPVRALLLLALCLVRDIDAAKTSAKSYARTTIKDVQVAPTPVVTRPSRPSVATSSPAPLPVQASVAVQAPAPVQASGVSPNGILGSPDFIEAIENVTVPLGREAILSCSVKELGRNKVGWMNMKDQTVLTMHDRVITHNSRVTVTNDKDTWQLHIRQVKESDKGCYMCQINTPEMKKQTGCIDVHMPPDIYDDNNETSSDVEVMEHENATLVCKARGHPEPRITWRRERGKMTPKDQHRHLDYDNATGPSLSLVGITRNEMGAYLCIASNDVPPAKSKRIFLGVKFAPSVNATHRRIGAPVGTDVKLECIVQAYPHSINDWYLVKNNKLIINSHKYIKSEERSDTHIYVVRMSLKIVNLAKTDFGFYKCTANNTIGGEQSKIELYEEIITTLPTTSTTTTTTTTTPRPRFTPPPPPPPPPRSTPGNQWLPPRSTRPPVEQLMRPSDDLDNTIRSGASQRSGAMSGCATHRIGRSVWGPWVILAGSAGVLLLR